MRWGEPTRLPPLRRGRGLAAAALLTVGLVAAYAILGVLSLTSVAPSFLHGLPRTIGAGSGEPTKIPAVRQRLRDLATVAATGSPASLGLDTLDLGRVLPGTPPTHV